MLHVIDLTNNLPAGVFYIIGEFRQALYIRFGLELDSVINLEVVGWEKKGNKMAVDFGYVKDGKVYYPALSLSFTMDSLQDWFEQVKKTYSELEPFKVQDLFDYSILIVSPDKVLWCFDFDGVVKSLKNQEPTL